MGQGYFKGGEIMMYSDIDIDFANREELLTLIKSTPARLESNKKHSTGVYFTDIPVASDQIATLDHKHAEELGYFKLDLLNVNVYSKVRNETHLVELMLREPPWEKLWTDNNFCQQVVHIGNYHNLLQRMKPDSIPRMSMFLAVIRPGKAQLRNKSWKEINRTVWDRNVEGYTFRKSHSIAYAHLVVMHMNLLTEESS